jgi:hyperosmotically inducible protein
MTLAVCLTAGLSLTVASAQDSGQGKPTADQGKNDVNDRMLMQKIRKSIVDDKNLSTSAHNVKVISQSGKVTLRGPVQSDDEKRTLVERATDAAGAGNVVDELTVKPKKTN